MVFVLKLWIKHFFNQSSKKTWLPHLYYSKTIVNFQKGWIKFFIQLIAMHYGIASKAHMQCCSLIIIRPRACFLKLEELFRLIISLKAGRASGVMLRAVHKPAASQHEASGPLNQDKSQLHCQDRPELTWGCWMERFSSGRLLAFTSPCRGKIKCLGMKQGTEKHLPIPHRFFSIRQRTFEWNLDSQPPQSL